MSYIQVLISRRLSFDIYKAKYDKFIFRGFKFFSGTSFSVDKTSILLLNELKNFDDPAISEMKFQKKNRSAFSNHTEKKEKSAMFLNSVNSNITNLEHVFERDKKVES